MSAYIDLLFTRRAHPGSLLIRAATWSSWSHVDVVEDTFGNIPAALIGATSDRGVHSTWIHNRLALASKALRVRADLPDKGTRDRIFEWLQQQEGKPYDWTAILGIGLRRDWQQDDRWFCSELVAAAFAQAGVPLVRLDQWRVTPQDLAQSPLLRPVL